MKSMIPTMTIIAFLVAPLGAAFAQTEADAGPETSSRSVSYADLDLKSTDGASMLRDRIRRAAAAVAGEADVRDLATRDAFEADRDATLSRAMETADRIIASARSASTYAAGTMSAGNS